MLYYKKWWLKPRHFIFYKIEKLKNAFKSKYTTSIPSININNLFQKMYIFNL